MKKIGDVCLVGLFMLLAGIIYLYQRITNPGVKVMESCNRCGRLKKDWKYCKRCGTQFKK